MEGLIPFDSAASAFGSRPIDPVLTPVSPSLHAEPFSALAPGGSALVAPEVGVGSRMVDVVEPLAAVPTPVPDVPVADGITGVSLLPLPLISPLPLPVPLPAVELSQAQHLGDVLMTPGLVGDQTFVAQWTFREAKYNNEVGIFAVDGKGRVNGVEPGSQGYAKAVLGSASRHVLFHSGDRAGNWKKVTLSGGAYVGFYLIANANSDAWLAQSRGGGAPPPPIYFSVANSNQDGFNHSKLRSLGGGIWRFNWEDMEGGGDKDFNDVVFNFGKEGELVPGGADMQTPLKVTRRNRDSGFSGEMGLFMVDDSSGSVEGHQPGSAGYLQHALSAKRRQLLFAVDQQHDEQTLTLPAGAHIGWYLVNGSTLEAALASPKPSERIFLSYAAANADGLNHVYADPGANMMRWEASYGGGDRDFDDLEFFFEYGTPFRVQSAIPLISIESPPTASIEGKDTQVEFAVKLSQASRQPITVAFRTEDGSALSGLDYAALQGTLTFQPGEVELSVAIPLLDDLEREEIKSFGIILSSALNAQVSTSRGYAQILDNDAERDSTPPVADSETVTLPEGGSSSNLGLLSGDTDAPDDPTGAGLKVAQVNGISLASLSPQASGPYAGFYAIAGSNGTLQVKADGTAFYVHNGSDSTADSFTYRAVDAAGNLSNLATIGLAITPVDDTAPTVTAALLNDTGRSNTDKITQDPTVQGKSQGAATLWAAMDGGNDQEISETLKPDGLFSIGVEAYNKLSQGSLPDGAHELLVKARSSTGVESLVSKVSFTLDRTPPPVSFDLAPESDTEVLNDQITSERIVTLQGQSEVNADVLLQGTNLQKPTDALGRFSFSDVAMPSAGSGAFTLIATDVAGNQGRSSETLTRVGINGVPKITSTPQPSIDLKSTTLYSYQVVATDPDQDPLTYVLVRGPKEAQLSTDGLLTFNPDPATNGDYSVEIQVSDGRSGIDQQEFVVKARLNPDTGTIRGAVWDDRNRNGIWDRGTADSASEVLIDNGTNGYFNGFIGDLYPGNPSSPLASYFPGPNSSTGDPSVRFAVGPDLTGIEALGDWLGSPESALKNQNWSGLGKIPFSWPTNAELAIIYEIDGGKFGMDNLRGSFGADNGIYVWVNGEFRFGALDPGPAVPNEYANIDLGSLKPCKNYIQVLLEDHGVILGYDVKITGNRMSGQGELGIGHSTTYLDLNNNGSLDTGEPRRHTSGSSTDPCVINEGAYEFSGLLPGIYTVRNDIPKGWDQTYPASQYLAKDIAVNGSFEIAPSGDALGLRPGSSIIEGWNVTQGTVDSIVSWQASNGRISLDLDGTAGFGGVSQTFDTIVGRRYHVQFDLAGNSRGLPVVKRMEVSAGTDRETYEFDTTGKTYQSMGWMERTFEFTATDVKSTLQFRSLNQTGGIAGPALDNVRIYPILEKDNAWIVDVRSGDIKGNINFGITRNTSYTGDHDLQITSIDAEQLTIDPQLISVEGKLAATITNADVDAVNKPFRVGFFEDRNFNKAYDPDLDSLLTTVEVSDPLAAGQSLVVSADLSTFMAFAQAPIWGEVDLDNVVVETDETNNLNFSSSDCVIDTSAVAAPDLIASYLRSNETNGNTTIQARIGNAGSTFVAAGVSIAFYDGDPRTGGQLFGTALTSKLLEVGEFEDVSLTVASRPLNTVWVVADDDGTGVGKVRECDEGNNFYSLLGPGKAEIRGTIWSDRNGDGIFNRDGDTSENGLSAVTVYLDVNNNRRLDAGEPTRQTSKDNPRTADTNENGQYRFTNLSYGSYTVRELVPTAYLSPYLHPAI